MRMNMEPNAQQPQAANKPVMDVVPPPKPAATSGAPADGVKTPPAMPNDAAPAADAPDTQAKQGKPKAPRPPKAPRSGVGLAIAATIIITLGLAALFVYAYLRTNNISGL